MACVLSASRGTDAGQGSHLREHESPWHRFGSAGWDLLICWRKRTNLNEAPFSPLPPPCFQSGASDVLSSNSEYVSCEHMAFEYAEKAPV